MRRATELIERAKRLGVWLQCPSKDWWFSPEELEREQDGHFWPDAMDWRLVHPEECRERLKCKIVKAQEDLAAFEKRLQQGRREDEDEA